MSVEDPSDPGSGIFGLDDAGASAGVWIVPVPWDVTASYHVGAALGPEAIRRASHQLDLFDPGFGEAYTAGFHWRSAPPWLDDLQTELRQALVSDRRGGVAAVNEASARVNDYVRDQVRQALRAGAVPAVVGGDHSVSLGAIAATAEQVGPMGVLHFDAHADLRVAYEGFTWSHASVMDRVLSEVPSVTKLCQVGLRDFCGSEFCRIERDPRIYAVLDTALQASRRSGRYDAFVDTVIAGLPEQVYVSFDIDGLDPSLCPGTGTPVPGGLQFAEALLWIRRLAQSGRKIAGLDVVEVAPREGDREWNGNVGARLLYQLVGWSLYTRRAGATVK